MNASRAEIFALWKKKIPQVFQKRSRSGDLAARLAAPQSFIYKEMRGQLFPMNLQWETRKKENYDCSSKKTTKTTVFHWQKTEKKFTTTKKRSRRWRKEKKRVTSTKRKSKVLNRVASIIIDSWMFPIEEKHPIRGVAIEESAKVSLSLSLSLARKMTPTLPQNSQMRYLIKSALEPSLPLSCATNCVLMSPTPVYFYDEKTAKPQVSRSSLQCLSWLHY